ncbi:ABC transporter substrate-binding protein [Bradyrhizobium uaiense]|uniref:ABC transporter substrate-binding protein n=1 Tax=Bradyrhizobium uaiense TaxID=2594946 RepID=A0A6P1BUJ4_9BRAD|nr:ABC transporter substrate-binding protein [Bradyrhizobium uaiense]NEV01840.1 ABC transporter substrate-binding protein [Bradyrhizobium uaiense]
MNTQPFSKVSRRSFLACAAGGVAAPMILKASRAFATSDTVTLTSTGGSYQESLTKTVLNPFTEETGIKVNIVPIHEMAKIKAQLLTGNIEWDVVNLGGPDAAFGSKQGYWEKLDPSMFDVADLVIPPTSDIVTAQMFAQGIAWDPKKFGPGKHPSNFAEFFDITMFPGRRALRPDAPSTLEAALLADGVAPKDIYPLDVDRAFKVLERIKPSIAVWTATTTQSISLLQTGEIDFSMTYSNRVKATMEPGGGKPMAFSLDQVLIFADQFVVVKGAPNKENGMRLLAYMLRPEVQARLEEAVGLIPVSMKAGAMLSEAARKWQPNLRDPKNLVINNAYWSDNHERVQSRFKEWIQT